MVKKRSAWFVMYKTYFDTSLGMRSKTIQRRFRTKELAKKWWNKVKSGGSGEKGERELIEIYWSEY